MDFQSIIGDEAYFFLWTVAAVDDPDFILRVWIEFGVAHFERSIEESFSMVEPGPSAGAQWLLRRFIPHQVFLECDAGRFERARISFQPGTPDQVRLASDIPQVIVESAGTRISPVEDL